MDDLSFADAGALADKVRSKQISSRELTEHFIARIERFDGDLNAIVVRDFERARVAADEADRALASGDAPGPLHGVPMTIKESFDIAGLPTTWGIPVFEGNIASSDARAVVSFKKAGAVFMGKSNVPMNLADFQSYNDIYGTTNNPWDRARVPGGSSGGAAAALAAGLTGLECGSDIGGSIRNPAHFCGVYGHKPTWGVFPPQGHALPGMLAPPDIAVCGPLARSAADLRLAMGVAAGATPLDAPGWRLALPEPRKKSLAEFKVAIWADDALAPVAPEIAGRVTRIADVLASKGATLSDTARPEIDFPSAHVIYLKLLNAILGAGVPPEMYAAAQARAAQYDPADQSDEAVIARALVISHAEWLAAHNQRELLRMAWRSFFDDWDILICPQMPTAAFEHDHSPFETRSLRVGDEEQPYFKQIFWAGFAIAAYLPSTVFPTGPSAAGLPIGLQAVGAEYDDLCTIDFTRLVAEEIGGFVPPPDYV